MHNKAVILYMTLIYKRGRCRNILGTPGLQSKKRRGKGKKYIYILMETHLGNCCYNPIKGAVQGVKKQRYYCTSLSANTKIKK